MLTTAGSLLLTAVAFAPHFWLMRNYLPGTFEWDRAHTFLLQCAHPFRHDVEIAMRWRLLPPLVCRALGLRGWAALALPWAGIVACVAYVAQIHWHRSPDFRFVFGGTLLFATTSAVLAPMGWLGLNDAWCWLCLLCFTFGERWPVRAMAVFLAPWIDERFLIGLPLAVAVRACDRGRAANAKEMIPALAWLPYAALRLALFRHGDGGQTTAFVRGTLHSSGILIAMAPLGWWMGLRVAWVPVGYAVYRRSVGLGVLALGTLVVCLLLASDLSRSAAVVCPLAIFGGFLFQHRWPNLAPKAMLTLGISGLLVPAAHITYNKIAPISNVVIELLRLRHRP